MRFKNSKRKKVAIRDTTYTKKRHPSPDHSFLADITKINEAATPSRSGWRGRTYCGRFKKNMQRKILINIIEFLMINI